MSKRHVSVRSLYLFRPSAKFRQPSLPFTKTADVQRLRDNLELDYIHKSKTDENPKSRPVLTVTEIGEYVSHRSCERRFKLSFDRRSEARKLPFAERLFNALDPVLQREGQRREDEWERSLRKAELRDILPREGREEGGKLSWDDFLLAASRLDRGERAYAREVHVEADLGAFRAIGRIDFCTLNWINNRPRIRLVECKASRRDRTYQRIQVAAYGLLTRSLLRDQQVGGVKIIATDIECVVARIDESTNEAQVILNLTPLDLTQEEADIRVLTAVGGAFQRITTTILDDLDYQLDAKCDSCVFNIHCYPESARQRKLQLIGIEPSAVRSLASAGINRIDDLASIDLAGPQARSIRSTPGFNHSLAFLQQRAHARRGTLPGQRDPDTYEVEPLPHNPASQLPPHETNGARLIRVYLTVHYDYVENRVGAISAHTTSSAAQMITPWTQSKGKWQPEAIVRERIETDRDADNRPIYAERDVQGIDIAKFKASPWTGRYDEDTGAEREMLQSFFQELVEAIVSTATDDRAPIHFYVWSRSEISHLVEACSRVGSGLLRHLQELLGCRQPLDQLIFSCLETEVHNRFALGWTGRGLSVATSLTWFGQRFHWRRTVAGHSVDLDRIFNQDIFDFKTDLWINRDNQWTAQGAPNASSHKFEIRSRFYDTLSAPYWRAMWRTLPDPNTVEDRKVANAIRRYNEAAAPGLFRGYLISRAHALRWVEDAIRFKNPELSKPALKLADLTEFRLDVNSTADAAIDFLRLDQHVAATDWIAFHLSPPAYRVPTGRTLPLREVACMGSGVLSARIDLTGFDIDASTLQTHCTIQQNSFVRFTPSNADPTRGQTVAQLLRLGSTCVVNQLDWDRGTVVLNVIPQRQADLYRLLSYSYPDVGPVTDHGVLDESPTDFVKKRVESRLQALGTHHVCNWFDPTNPQIPPQTSLSTDLLEQLRLLAARFRTKDNRRLEEEQIAAAVEGLTSRVQLLQGPPGTGKTMTTAGAIFLRLRARCKAGDIIIVAANTHTAVNNLLDRLASMLESYSRGTADLKLDNLPIQVCKIQSSDSSARPEFQMAVLDAGTLSLRAVRELREDSVVIIGGTTGTLLKMSARLDSFALFGKRAGGFQTAMLIVDEASMMVFPEFLALATLVGNSGEMLLSGDHRQLAPIMAHDWEREDRPPIVLYQPYASAYDAIRNISLTGRVERTAVLLSALSYTFRLPAIVRELISRLYRRDDIELVGRPPAQRIPSTGNSLSVWQKVWQQSAGLFLIVHEEMQSTHHNAVEAEIIALVLEGGAKLPANSVAIITPHRAQRNLLNQRLAAFRSHDGPVGVVDTVERLQGGERANIIVSATESDPASIASRAEFILNLNRSNVAFSRAGSRLIVVVSKILLDHVPAEIEDYESTLLWKSLREICSEPVGTAVVNNHGVTVMTPSEERLRTETE